MKRILNLCHQNPFISLIANSIAFFAWMFTLLIIISVMVVAFTG